MIGKAQNKYMKYVNYKISMNLKTFYLLSIGLSVSSVFVFISKTLLVFTLPFERNSSNQTLHL